MHTTNGIADYRCHLKDINTIYFVSNQLNQELKCNIIFNTTKNYLFNNALEFKLLFDDQRVVLSQHHISNSLN